MKWSVFGTGLLYKHIISKRKEESDLRNFVFRDTNPTVDIVPYDSNRSHRFEVWIGTQLTGRLSCSTVTASKQTKTLPLCLLHSCELNCFQFSVENWDEEDLHVLH